MDEDEAIQNVFMILDDLNSTDILYIFGDLCTLQGWTASILLDNPNRVGDLSVTRVTPYPETVEVIYFEGDELSESQLHDWASNIELSNNNRLTVISQGTPTAQAFKFADERAIGILGVADLAKEMYQLSVEDILAEVVTQDEALMEAHKSRLAELGCQIREETETSDSYANSLRCDSVDNGFSPEDVPSVEVDHQLLNLELLGYEHIDTSKYDTEGIIAAIEIKSKEEDLDVEPANFTLHSTDECEYSAVNLKSKYLADSVAQKFATELVNSLPKKWHEPTSLGRFDTSTNGRIKGILYFPCDSDTIFNKVKYEKIESGFGLGSVDKYSFEMLLSDAQRKYYNNLPDILKSVL